jgi:hypothetical protein
MFGGGGWGAESDQRNALNKLPPIERPLTDEAETSEVADAEEQTVEE